MDWIVLGLAVSLCLIFLFTRDALALLFLGCFRYNISMENEEQGVSAFACFCACSLDRSGVFHHHSRPLVFSFTYALTDFPSLPCFIILGALCTWTLLGTYSSNVSAGSLIVLLLPIFWNVQDATFVSFRFCLYSFFTGILPNGKSRRNAVLIAAIVVFSAGYVFYVLRSLKIFLSAGFSLFFWILYLCILEVIPIGVLIHFLAGIRL